jgi:hypothetical protein
MTNDYDTLPDFDEVSYSYQSPDVFGRKISIVLSCHKQP